MPSPSPGPAALTDSQAARFVLQAQFSVSDADLARVKLLGYPAWLDEQFAIALPQTACAWMDSRGYDAINDQTSYFDMQEAGQFAIWQSLFTAPDGVRKRMALALSEYFVVSFVGVTGDFSNYAVACFWDVLCAGALGNFRNLLEDVTLSYAMGFYLNMLGNLKENPATGRQPDENYAREVMQLFTIGLRQLNLDGTEKVDGAGKQIDTYTQDDVTNLARVFTGWNGNFGGLTKTPAANNRNIYPSTKGRRPMVLDASKHSSLAATFLGATVPVGTEGSAALRIALDTLFNHPNVGPFFGKQMIQRLVTSNPSQAYVARVAAAFNDNGAGVRGDLKAVLRAVLLDTEARSDAGLTQAGCGKVREPMLRFLQWGRTFQLTSSAGSWKLSGLVDAAKLGQSPLSAPSVFNFFRPGYVPPGTAMAASKAPAPEFQIINETTTASYLNYMQGAIRKGLNVPSPEVPQRDFTHSGYDLLPNYVAELALVTDAAALVARLNTLLCAGQLSAATAAAIVTALNATPVTTTSTDAIKLDRVAAAVLLVMACPEYLVQK